MYRDYKLILVRNTDDNVEKTTENTSPQMAVSISSDEDFGLKGFMETHFVMTEIRPHQINIGAANARKKMLHIISYNQKK